MKKEKKSVCIVLSILFTLLLISTVSAGWLDWVKKTITGYDTQQNFDLNITVGAPAIYAVYNHTKSCGASNPYVQLTENTYTSAIINFSVYSPSGAGNINISTAKVNLSYSGENLRENASCKLLESSGNYANFTCNITMWWWDVGEDWNVTAYIEDNSSSSAINDTVIQNVANTTSFLGGPSPLTWAGISPESANQTSNNDPYLMNNTGNVAIPSTLLTINSTNLRGELTSTEALWAGNFSVGWNTGGTPPAECGGTSMVRGQFTALSIANLTRGNYTINNGITGQERLYFCLKVVGSELSTQAYSTANETEGVWTVKIVA
jgi:hypothetical protein